MKKELEGKDVTLLVEGGLKTKEDLGERSHVTVARCYFLVFPAAGGDRTVVKVSNIRVQIFSFVLPEVFRIVASNIKHQALALFHRNWRHADGRPLLPSRVLLHVDFHATKAPLNIVYGTAMVLRSHSVLIRMPNDPAPPPRHLLFHPADRVKAAGISCVVVGEALIREEDPAKAAEALLL